MTKDELRREVLAELADRYTTLPDNYRRHVMAANTATLRQVWRLALADGPGHDICLALDID
jgi:hypothetical protein